MIRKVYLAVFLALAVAACGGPSPPTQPVANCGPSGVQSLHVDNYGGEGHGREIITCRDGRVFVGK